MISSRALPRVVLVPALIGAGLGALAGLAALQGRGAVELGEVRIEGWSGVLTVSAILALMGLMLGLILMLIMRALSAAATGDK